MTRLDKSWEEFCIECDARYKKQGKKPPCEKCKPVVSPGNCEVIDLIDMYDSVFFYEGNICIEGIRCVLDIEDIKEKGITLQKIMIYVFSVLNIIRNKDSKVKSKLDPADGVKVKQPKKMKPKRK